MKAFTVNGRSYAPPERPVVVVCIDGCADEYLSVSLARGAMPRLAGLLARGAYRGLARGALPSFTNVNNAAIVCGAPPAVTGIAGNYFLDPETGQEVMMNSSAYLRSQTILAAAAAGRKVGFITAKDKLREIFSKGLQGIAFSSEKVDEARRETHGIEHVEALVGRFRPEIYSAEASLYVLEAGAALVERGLADFCYLSLTDYMQHKFAPEAPESLEFHAGIDACLGRLCDLGAVLGVTADHGMNAKNREDGTPNVIYLESELQERFGTGVRVICPITDPYVVHHGALGSLVMVHLAEPGRAAEVEAWLWEREGVSEVHGRARAARKLELPPDRIGDLTVLGGRNVVLGRTPAHHDLSLLGGGLRSHGGRYEEMVPFLVSEPLSPAYLARAQGDPRNFDIFDFVCNGLAAPAG